MTATSPSNPTDAAIDPARLPTPYLLVDEQRLFNNLNRLANYGSQHGINLRPHAKTHKSLWIAQQQLDRGAIGLTVAKPGEAEIFAKICDDLLLAYPVVDAATATRVAKLARKLDLKVAVDSDHAIAVLAEAARQADATIGVLVDQDIGMHRTGVATSAEALALGQQVDQASRLELRGLFCYPGQIWASPDEQPDLLRKACQPLEETLDQWRRHGLSAEIVSGGSTPTAYQAHAAEAWTEIRSGTYALNDMNCVAGGYAKLDDCAARIVATVVSVAVSDQVVIDAGSKTLTSDRCLPTPDSGHGLILEYPDAKIDKLSEEHGQVDVRRCRPRPRLGERVTIIPNHICPCVNLQDTAWRRDADGSCRPLPIEARGKSR